MFSVPRRIALISQSGPLTSLTDGSSLGSQSGRGSLRRGQKKIFFFLPKKELARKSIGPIRENVFGPSFRSLERREKWGKVSQIDSGVTWFPKIVGRCNRKKKTLSFLFERKLKKSANTLFRMRNRGQTDRNARGEGQKSHESPSKKTYLYPFWLTEYSLSREMGTHSMVGPISMLLYWHLHLP